MFTHPTTPTSHSTIVRVLTVVVLPVAIYALQLLGKIYSLAALVAGVLVGLKILLELLNAPVPARSSTHSTPPVQPQPSIQCHYCHRRRGAFRLHPNPDHRLPPGTAVCDRCYEHYLLTATYMSTHYEPL